MVRTVKCNERLCPKLPQHGDLLFDAAAAVPKVFPERFIFDVVPTQTNPEAKAAATEDIDLGALLGHQSCLPLRQDDDSGRELKAPSDSGKKPEKDHRLVKRMFVRVRAGQLRLALGMRSQDMVVDEQIIISELFSRLRIILDRLRVVSELDLGEYHAVLHRGSITIVIDQE